MDNNVDTKNNYINCIHINIDINDNDIDNIDSDIKSIDISNNEKL